MALTDESSGIPATMLVGPTGFGGTPYPVYQSNGGGFGSNGADGWWIILLLLALGGGWGNGFGGGFGGNQLGYDFPWLMNGQQNIQTSTSDGFRDAQLHDSITSVRDGVSALATQLCNCCGDIQMSLCNGFSGVTAAVTGAQNSIAQQLYANQIADMERSFAAQTASTQGMTTLSSQLAQCCCDNRLATANLGALVQSENCADRAALSDGIRDIITNQTANTQRILDQMCADRISQKDDTIAQLRQEVLFARGQASQDVQTAAIRAGQATTANQLVTELRSCPIPTMPVYGMTPIFTCPNQNNSGCGCGCGSF
jgi:hypothetical protein